MQQEISINTIAAEASVSLAKDFVLKTFGAITSRAKFAYEATFTDFETYLAEIHQKISKVKIITSKDFPVDFNNIYVPSNYICANKSYSDAQVLESIIAGRRCVISGNGGAGKTFMMKKIWLELFRRQVGKAPILVELRKLNSLSTYEIESFIRINAFGAKTLSERAFEHFCDQGCFVFILDGFDEVSREKRAELERQVIELSVRYKDCGLVVSGRPDERFDSWSEFYTFKSQPMDYLQFRALISKVPFDQDIKKAFSAIAKNEFFDRHKEFLSNPLLAIMMLLTFRDNAEIPSRLSTFYENCFSTLYAQHDALKESFNRKKALDQLQFKRLFAVFSLKSYIDNKHSLDGAEFISYIEKAKIVAGVRLSNEDISHDIMESVNLILKDGLQYTYIHRSFQEFFAAYCVTNVISSNHENFLSLFAKRDYDSTLRLTYEIHPNLVEDKLIIPKYQSLKDNSLPRKSIKERPYNALYQSGIKLEISFRIVRLKEGRSAYVVHSFRPTWSRDYDEIVAAVGAAQPVASFSQVEGLIGRVLDCVSSDLWEPLSRERGEVVADDAGEIQNIELNISFSQTDIIVDIGKNDDSIEMNDYFLNINHLLEVMAKNLEKITIDNNKIIIRFVDDILDKKSRSDDVLGDFVI